MHICPSLFVKENALGSRERERGRNTKCTRASNIVYKERVFLTNMRTLFIVLLIIEAVKTLKPPHDHCFLSSFVP